MSTIKVIQFWSKIAYKQNSIYQKKKNQIRVVTSLVNFHTYELEYTILGINSK